MIPKNQTGNTRPGPADDIRKTTAAFFERQLATWRQPGALQNIYLGSSAFCDPAPEDNRGMLNVLPWYRMVLMLKGTQHYAISAGGVRREVWLQPGDVLYWTRHAWQVEFWASPCVFLGVIFREELMRLILVEQQEPGPPPEQQLIYHTAGPLVGAAPGLINSLSFLAETGSESGAARPILSALLTLAGEHLTADRTAPVNSEGHAAYRWHLVHDYLREHFALPINRKTVAATFGLHPNYLSHLATSQTGKNFQEIIEHLRLEEARRLLRQSRLNVERIAASCGYRSASYFVTAFRRRNGLSPSQYREAMPPTPLPE